MGGCRCYFRDCHVSSQKFPGMHFFRFPLKESERYKKWRQYSQMDQMLKFSEVRRKNTSICARHFRTECFMNYKSDRLTLSAVPTITRLSDDKALDFELDIENGVLVNLEQPKQKHLLPPDGFESPLFLKNDKILLEKLNELQSQQYITSEHIDFIDLKEGDCEIVLENSSKPLAESVEVLDTIEVAATSLKRPRHRRNELVNGINDKKCRILNTSNCTVGNDIKEVSTVVLTSIENDFESEEINFVETIQIDSCNELSNDDDQLFLTNNSLINDDYTEDLEIFQIHKDENESHSELPLNDSDATVVQIKSQNPSNLKKPENIEILNSENQFEYDQIKEDLDSLHVKYSILEAENRELKNNCQQNEELKRKHLLLQAENNDLKESLKEFNLLKEKLHQYSTENERLKTENTNFKALKIELISRREETKELKKLLDTLKTDDLKKPNIELTVKNREINGLRKKVDSLQQKFNNTVSELKKFQTNLSNVENENKRLIEQENELKISMMNIQNNFDLKQTEYNTLKTNYEDLQSKQSVLQQKYWKMQALQNQEATVSTSLEGNKSDPKTSVPPTPPISAASLTKAQLFNGIKRYLCSSMVSLVRMEMFGNTEREWKTDERQVAVDILRLGEMAYKYFTDEWRIRLPALRDARDWLSQSQQVMEEEEDL